MAERLPSDRRGQVFIRHDSCNYISFCACARQGKTTQCQCGEEQQEMHWVWDIQPAMPSDNKKLQDGGRGILFHPHYSNGTAAVRGSRPLGPGQHYWEVKMTTPVYGTDMMVGVATCRAQLDHLTHQFTSLLGENEESWGLSYHGTVHHGGVSQQYTKRRVIGQGSIIGVHLDAWLGHLSFSLNRQPLGLAFDGLAQKELYPVVTSTAARSGMRVIATAEFPSSLQFMCAQTLRRLVPHDTHVLDHLPLPPGLASSLRRRLDWLLRPSRFPCPLRPPLSVRKPKRRYVCHCGSAACNNYVPPPASQLSDADANPFTLETVSAESFMQAARELDSLYPAPAAIPSWVPSGAEVPWFQPPSALNAGTGCSSQSGGDLARATVDVNPYLEQGREGGAWPSCSGSPSPQVPHPHPRRQSFKRSLHIASQSTVTSVEKNEGGSLRETAETPSSLQLAGKHQSVASCSGVSPGPSSESQMVGWRSTDPTVGASRNSPPNLLTTFYPSQNPFDGQTSKQTPNRLSGEDSYVSTAIFVPAKKPLPASSPSQHNPELHCAWTSTSQQSAFHSATSPSTSASRDQTAVDPTTKDSSSPKPSSHLPALLRIMKTLKHGARGTRLVENDDTTSSEHPIHVSDEGFCKNRTEHDSQNSEKSLDLKTSGSLVSEGNKKWIVEEQESSSSVGSDFPSSSLQSETMIHCREDDPSNEDANRVHEELCEGQEDSSEVCADERKTGEESEAKRRKLNR